MFKNRTQNWKSKNRSGNTKQKWQTIYSERDLNLKHILALKRLK